MLAGRDQVPVVPISCWAIRSNSRNRSVRINIAKHLRSVQAVTANALQLHLFYHVIHPMTNSSVAMWMTHTTVASWMTRRRCPGDPRRPVEADRKNDVRPAHAYGIRA